MAFVVALSCFFSFIAGGAVYFLLRRRRWRAVLVAGVVLIATPIWLLHSVCVPVSAEEVAQFDPPIENRTETGLAGQRIFQARDGGWAQCKAWIARAFYF